MGMRRRRRKKKKRKTRKGKKSKRRQRRQRKQRKKRQLHVQHHGCRKDAKAAATGMRHGCSRTDAAARVQHCHKTMNRRMHNLMRECKFIR